MRIVIGLAVLLTLTTPRAMAAVAIEPGPAWVDSVGPRPAPRTGWLEMFDEENRRGSAHDHWLAFLKSLGLAELSAPKGGRAYRWFWFGTNPYGPLLLQAPHRGFVEVIVDASGHAELRSVWRERAAPTSADALAPFEAALSATTFATDAGTSTRTCLDECEDQVMEAIVSGKYHVVANGGGGVRDAGVLLEQLARSVAGKPAHAAPAN